MFGISLTELLIVVFIAIFFVKPQDLPEIAHFLGKLYAKSKKTIENFKNQFKDAEKDLGLDKIKQEFSAGLVEEEVKNGEKKEIIDIYGNVHKVDPSHVNGDFSDEELKKEIEKYNKINKLQEKEEK